MENQLQKEKKKGGRKLRDNRGLQKNHVVDAATWETIAKYWSGVGEGMYASTWGSLFGLKPSEGRWLVKSSKAFHDCSKAMDKLYYNQFRLWLTAYHPTYF